MNPHAVVGTNLADLPPSTHREKIAEGTRIKSEQHGFRIVHPSRHQHAVAKAEDFRPVRHFGSNVTIFGQAACRLSSFCSAFACSSPSLFSDFGATVSSGRFGSGESLSRIPGRSMSMR